METSFYNTSLWRAVAERAKARDAHACTVARLLGGPCKGRLHSHHIVPLRDGGARFDLSNIGTACAAHHAMWEGLRRVLVERRGGRRPRCPHEHRDAEARRLCEARLARKRPVAA